MVDKGGICHILNCYMNEVKLAFDDEIRTKKAKEINP
jgi:hypothetical protein